MEGEEGEGYIGEGRWEAMEDRRDEEREIVTTSA